MDILAIGDLKPRYKLDDRFHREDERLKTFKFWPLKFIDCKEMAMIGFFYTGDADKTKCYFCEVEIHSWQRGDTPLSEHIRWSKNCPLIRRCTTNNVAINSNELNRLLPQLNFDICGPNICTLQSRFDEYRSNVPALQYRNPTLKNPKKTSKDSTLPTFLIFMLSIFIFKEINTILKK